MLTFHLVCLCWLFFANATFSASLLMMEKIAFEFHGELFTRFLAGYPIVTALIVLGFVLHFLPESWSHRACGLVQRASLPVQVLLLVAMIFFRI